MGGLGFYLWHLAHHRRRVRVVPQLCAGEALGPQQMAAGMLVLFLAFGNGLIGFLDDFIKVIKHRNLGLTP